MTVNNPWLHQHNRNSRTISQWLPLTERDCHASFLPHIPYIQQTATDRTSAIFFIHTSFNCRIVTLKKKGLIPKNRTRFVLSC